MGKQCVILLFHSPTRGNENNIKSGETVLVLVLLFLVVRWGWFSLGVNHIFTFLILICHNFNVSIGESSSVALL